MTTLALLTILLEETPETSSESNIYVTLAVVLGIVLFLRFRPGRK